MSEKKSRPPVVVFAFRRPLHLRAMFESLQKCSGFEDTPVIVFVDGPRTADDEAGVGEVKQYLNSLNLRNVKVVCRDSNHGLRKSIFLGVGEVCVQYGRAIVLEDDLILSPVTLDYFRDALDKYAAVEDVWSVSAYMYNVPALYSAKEAIVLPYAHPWGWATWQRAWRKYELDSPIDVGNLKSRSFQRAFDVGGLRDMHSLLQLSVSGHINSWYIRWYYTIFMARGVSVFPPRSYVKNIGVAGRGGTHGSELNPYYYLMPENDLSTRLVNFPDSLETNYAVLDKLISSRDARVQRLISFLGAIKRRLF